MFVALQAVVAVTTGKTISALPAPNEVSALSTVDLVIASPTIDKIIAPQAVDRVVPSTPKQDFAALGGTQRVSIADTNFRKCNPKEGVCGQRFYPTTKRLHTVVANGRQRRCRELQKLGQNLQPLLRLRRVLRS